MSKRSKSFPAVLGRKPGNRLKVCPHGLATWSCRICVANYHRRYDASPVGKARRRRYVQSPKGKAAKKRADRKYSQTSKGKIADRRKQKKYLATAKGRKTRRKAMREWRAKKKNLLTLSVHRHPNRSVVFRPIALTQHMLDTLE